MKNSKHLEKILGIAVLMIFISTAFAGASISEKTTQESIINSSSQQERDDYTHYVLVEGCTWTNCGPCVTAAGYILELYESGLYDFYYVAIVYPSNNPYTNIRENELGHTGYYPDYYFDGGYYHLIGAPGSSSTYANYINSCGARDVADVDLDLDIEWLGNAQIGVSLDVTNNEGSTYNGHAHVYITEKISRWHMQNGQPYHYAWIGDWAINEDVTVQGTETEQLTATWDANQYGFGNIEPDNIFVVATIFDDSTQDTDETTAAHIGESDPPETPVQPEGPTEGEVGIEYYFYTTTTDPEQNDIYYQFHWGEKVGDWLGPYDSGETVNISHVFTVGGDHEVKVRAKDTSDATSNYSESLLVDIAGPILEIGNIKGGLFGISVEFENTGERDTSDVNYSISVTGGLLNKIDIEKEGIISSFSAESKKTKTVKPIIGLGDITIKVEVDAPYGGSVEKVVTGKVLLFLVTIDSEE